MEFLRLASPALARLQNADMQVSAATARRVESTDRIWEHFVTNYLTRGIEVPSVEDVVAFFVYRVSSWIPDDPFAGRIALSTFMNTELAQLLRVLRPRYSSQLTLSEVRDHVFFKNAIRHIDSELGEKRQSTHARVIWHQDELRLLAATSPCTMGLQDRALIRVLIRSGGRAHDVRSVTTLLHIEEAEYHDGTPAIRIFLPSIKNQRGDVVETWLTREAYTDVHAWLERRRVIFTESPYLFITNTGKQISAESVTMSFKTLSAAAGYGVGFFTSHSGRMSFGSRLAARVFSNGGNVNYVYARAGATGLWSTLQHVLEVLREMSEKLEGLERLVQGLARINGLDSQQERPSECVSGAGGYLSQHAFRSVREVRRELEQVSYPREWRSFREGSEAVVETNPQEWRSIRSAAEETPRLLISMSGAREETVKV